MSIYMTGINYSNTDIVYREKLSLTIKQQVKLADQIIGLGKVKGCIFLSTCNRTKL